ncbi:hypothetical protein BgiBS90_027669, partial [Biomphalaria glabrata]
FLVLPSNREEDKPSDWIRNSSWIDLITTESFLSIPKRALDCEDLINQFSQQNAREADFCDRQGSYKASLSSIASVLVHLCK